jgi:hypothetical protein
MTSSSPASAAGSPRVSGMSKSTIPLSARRAASRAMVLGATVEAMPTISPRRAAPAMPSRPSRTASASLSKPTTMMTKSLRSATARGLSASAMPDCCAWERACASISYPVTSNLARAR